MKILLLSYYFPPSRSIGALRVGKLAKYLHRFGHEVKVIAARNQWWDGLLPQDLKVEIPSGNLVLVEDRHTTKLRSVALGKRLAQAPPSTRPTAIENYARQHLKSALLFPDAYAEWGLRALSIALDITRNWQPDIIVASALPATTLFVARAISAVRKVPWVAEYRDLWSLNPYYGYSSWRRKIDRAMERALLSSARALVTVTEGLAKDLKRLTRRPVFVIRNGYDSEDLRLIDSPDSAPGQGRRKLRIVHTGTLVEDVRDPRLLFQAISSSRMLRRMVTVEFAGRNLNWIGRLAADYGIQESVRLLGDISLEMSLQLQGGADLLLLIIPNSDKDALPGKLYEYIGAGKYILCVGNPAYEAPELITSHGLGEVFERAQDIMMWLESLVSGLEHLPKPASIERDKFTREFAAQCYETLLSDLLTAE